MIRAHNFIKALTVTNGAKSRLKLKETPPFRLAPDNCQSSDLEVKVFTSKNETVSDVHSYLSPYTSPASKCPLGGDDSGGDDESAFDIIYTDIIGLHDIFNHVTKLMQKGAEEIPHLLK